MPSSTRIAEVAGTRVRADVAIVFDWERLVGRPSSTATRPPTSTYLDRHLALYRALWDAGVAVDLVAPGRPTCPATGWSSCPTLYLVTDAGAANIGGYVDGGGTAARHLLERHRRRARPRPARRLSRRLPRPARRARGGVLPAAPGRDGARSPDGVSTVPRPTCGPSCSTSTAPRRSRRYVDGPLPGVPAVTAPRQRDGHGVVRRDASRPLGHGQRSCATCATTPASSRSPTGCRASRSCDGTATQASYLFVLNHTDAAGVGRRARHRPAHRHDLRRDARGGRRRRRRHPRGRRLTCSRRQRQALILEQLGERGGVRVSDLTRDPRGLGHDGAPRPRRCSAGQGLLDKVHGGATLRRTRSTDEPGFQAKSVRELAEKDAIAGAAAELVEPGSAIGLSAGTTTWTLAQHLLQVPDITVVTNSVPVATSSTQRRDPDQTVVLTGGVRTPSDALVGPVAVAAAARRCTSTCVFLGVHGMDERTGLHDAQPHGGRDQPGAVPVGPPAGRGRRPHQVGHGRALHDRARCTTPTCSSPTPALRPERRELLTDACRRGDHRAVPPARTDGCIVKKTTTQLADGREIIYFDSDATTRTDRARRRPPDLEPTRTASEIRYDAILDEWVAIASHRQGRTHLPPADECPLCPSPDGRQTESRRPTTTSSSSRTASRPSPTDADPGCVEPTGELPGRAAAGARSCASPVDHDSPLSRCRPSGCAWCSTPGSTAPGAVRAAGRRAGVLLREPRRGDRRHAGPPARPDLRLPVRHAAHPQMLDAARRPPRRTGAQPLRRPCWPPSWPTGRGS